MSRRASLVIIYPFADLHVLHVASLMVDSTRAVVSIAVGGTCVVTASSHLDSRLAGVAG
jgi:hypothetical protein